MSHQREREVVLAAVREAAQLCQTVQTQLVSSLALKKSDRSPVTVADFGSQALVCRRLKAAFPNDPIVGEEDAAALRKPDRVSMLDRVVGFVTDFEDVDAETVCRWIDAGNGQVADRFWTLDPIDGTKGFLRGEQYAVALALIEQGDVKVAAVACPNLPVDIADSNGSCGVLFVAERGQGAVAMGMDGSGETPICVASPEDGDAMRFVESVESGHSDHDRQQAIARAVGIEAPSLRMDSQAKYGAVARGDAALYLRLPSPGQPDYREKIWDHAAGALVVEEAGGRVTDMHGRPLNFALDARMHDNRGVIVSNGAIHDRVIETLGKSD